jgi:cell wall-associated NlpC family hydrolase
MDGRTGTVETTRSWLLGSSPMRRATFASRRFFLFAVTVLSLSVVGSATAAISRQQAYRLGKAGKTAPQILARAFPGVHMSRMKEAPIRVLLGDDLGSAVVTGQTDLKLRDSGNASFVAVTLLAEHRYEIKRTATGMVVTDLDAPATKFTLKGAALVDSLGAPTGVHLAKPSSIDRRFRGVLRIQKGRAGRVQVINILDVEDYLLGTLPGDMPPTWGARAPSTLRAGAIALRSRALTQRKLPTAPFDFTASDPRYLGLDGERTRTTLAVQSTRNLTLRRSGFPFPASFSGNVAMGSMAFQPRAGKPFPVAFGPTKAVEGAAAGKAQAALSLAMTFLGVPYRWGGTTPAGFDCSGLVFYVYGRQGVKLPRVAADQARVGQPVTRIEDLLPGDAVFFADSSGYIHHMGLYIGGGKMIHAPHTGDVVRIQDITTGYYAQQFAGGRRYVPAA